MSIRFKTILAITAVFSALFILLYIVTERIIVETFVDLETGTLTDHVERSQNALWQQVAALSAAVSDWAYWDATYAYLNGENPTYPEDNLSYSPDVLINLDVDFVVIRNLQGAVLFALAVDRVSGTASEVDPVVLSHLPQTISSGSSSPSSRELRADRAGFIRVGEQLAMTATRWVLNSSFEGPVPGTFTFGRYVDASRMHEFASALRLDVRLEPVIAAASISDGIIITPLGENTIRGTATVSNLQGEPVAHLIVTTPREVYQHGQSMLRLMATIVVLTGVVLAVVTSAVINRLIVRRVQRLGAEVDAVQAQASLTQRVTTEADDEVTGLARNINTMLERLETARGELQVKNVALERAYHEADDAARLKSEFLSVMPHELRTPLNAIIGYSGIMREGIGGELDDDALRMVGNIYDSSNHLLRLVNDVLDLSKVEAGRMEFLQEPYSIRELVQEVATQMRVLADDKALRFEVDVKDEVPPAITGDPSRVKQVLINLLSNAIKFTEQGSVTVLVEHCQKSIHIRVQDTGIGIPPHALTYIFDEFRQVDGTARRQHGGTGLGLAIVRKLVTAMGGQVQVQSELGKGSTFSVMLPLQVELTNPSPFSVA